MMRKELSDYIKSPKDFERFCNLFLKKEVSPFVKVYGAAGRDGGIDADYTGVYNQRDGTWIFQYKFFDPTKDKNQARRSLISTMEGGKYKKGELDKAAALQCDHYVLMTNTLLTAGNVGKIENAKKKKEYIFSLTCWDAEDLITMTDEFPYILNSFRQPHLPVFLPWQDMFRDQVNGKHRLLRYDYETFGREDEIDRFQTFVRDVNKRLFMLYGSGGIGKTKLAIEFAKIAEKEHTDYTPLFVQIGEDNFENALGDVPENRKYIFFIDNAHDFLDNLRGIKAIVNSPGYSGSKVVLITRKPFKAPLKGIFLSSLPDGAIDELEILKLSQEKTKEFIRAYTRIPNGSLLTKLSAIGRDTPLISVMVIYLLNNEVDLRNLTKDKLIELAFESYLNDIFSQHLPKLGEQHQKLLIWLSGITPIDAEDNQIREKLTEILKLETYEIEQYREDLIECGLLVQIGRKQRIFPDPLSDYILEKACFPSKQRPSSFHENLLREFLSILPVNIIKNLARVEDIAGEAILLDDYVSSLQSYARTGDNAVRMLILLQMDGICYFRPDDAVEIFNIIIDNPNGEDTEVKDEFWGKFWQTHQSLIEKITTQARKTVYTLSGFSKTLEIVRKLLLMKDITFSSVDSPVTILTEMIQFETGKSFTFQRKALETFEKWQREDKPKLSLILLDVLDSLLVLNFHEVFTQGGSLQSVWYSLNYSAGLIQLRAKTIDLIEECLKTSRHNVVKVKAIECIKNSLNPLRGPDRNNPDHMEEYEKAQLQKEQERLFVILANQIQNESDLTILNAIDSCLHGYAESSDQFLKEKATELLAQFREHENLERYFLYRQFFGQFQDWDNREKIPSFVKEFISKYSPVELSKLMRECIEVAEKVRGSGAAYPLWETGLLTIGELDATYGTDLLNHILAWQIGASYYASRLLIGIRHSNNDKAREAIHSLLNENDIFAKRIIAGSYLRTSESQIFYEEDLQILSQLSETPDVHLRCYITQCLPNFYIVDTSTVLEILVKLSVDDSPWVSMGTINALISKELKFSPQEHLDIYKQVMENCLHLEKLNVESEVALHTIFISDPTWVITFLEKRVAYQEEESKNNTNFGNFSKSSGYEAIPIQFHYLFKDVDWKDKEAMDALRQVRNWVLTSSGYQQMVAPGLLASMTGRNNARGGEIQINRAMQRILEEWINSEDSKKMWWAAYLMRNFDEDELFYSIVELLLIKSMGDEKVKNEIEASIGTVSYFGSLGEPLPHLEKRIEYVKALREKTQSPIVAQFTDHLIDRTKQEIKRELQRDEEILEGERW